MRKVLAHTLEKFALVYIDDIIIFSDTFEDHIKHINEVFQCLKKANLMVAKDKAHFCLKGAVWLYNNFENCFVVFLAT